MARISALDERHDRCNNPFSTQDDGADRQYETAYMVQWAVLTARQFFNSPTTTRHRNGVEDSPSTPFGMAWIKLVPAERTKYLSTGIGRRTSIGLPTSRSMAGTKR